MPEGFELLKPAIDRKYPGRLLFAKVWGSRSHNTELPTSDTDYLAVYAAPPSALLSIDGPTETLETHEPDLQAHEVRKFCGLLLKGNPGILEMLWTEKMTYETSEWIDLKRERSRFLSAEAIRQYLGYAQGQLRKLSAHGGTAGLHTKGGEYNEKWAYHIVRLLLDAAKIAAGKDPVIWKEETDPDREILMSIRHGQVTREFVETFAHIAIHKIESLKPWPLPEFGDKAFLDRWLMGVRINEMVGSGIVARFDKETP